MKAKELRINNLLQDSKTGSLLVVTALSNNTIISSVLGRDKYPLPNGWKAEPILLTEEWLERFEDINWLSKDIGGFFYWFDGEKKYVEFVHALQNTYFYIEQKELKWRGF